MKRRLGDGEAAGLARSKPDFFASVQEGDVLRRPFAGAVDCERITRMLSRFLDRFRRKAKRQTALEVLEAGRGVEAVDRDLSRVVPIILPLELLTSAWPGPIVQIGDLPFCAAWATCGEMNTFFYVTEREAQFWDEAGINWRATALANLARMSEERPASGEKLDEDGLPFLKVMLHDDAFGPSRLLLPHLFDEILGTGYEVAIPEQTCAIAYRTNLSSSQKVDVNGVIDGCYEHGTEPMSAERFKAHRFWDFAKGASF
ncbi:hypothetical protein K9B33_09115 [Sphingobium sp. 3R8]|uniref:hypothetical protein n=1 Tax=Sphingobium sp. 3R8 TaxID=2874921 RepID=UPI001CCFABD7|nr:hypothetical protein [Sphingobium sp. 3R8]MBZ9647701.1 hypothetical protein [Sphingobium sp. 3R8]